MTLKVSQIYNAALAVEQIRIRHELPYRTVRAFQQLRRALKSEADNVRSEQVKLIEMHHGKIKDDGKIGFANHDDLAAFETAWNALLDDDADLDIAPVDLSEYADYVNFNGIDVDIDALCNFITLERGAS